MIFQPYPTPPNPTTPQKTGNDLKIKRQKRCATSVRVVIRHYQIRSSDDDLIGDETRYSN